MKTYLVGGAVRDQLLGLPVEDKDWVVVGSSVEQMLDRGFKSVGKDFPVFLHPETHEEHALARTERKSGHGYTGFEFYASPDVTLEQDLQRRDLTINAMALNDQGKLIDPWNGEKDLHDRKLRHVSKAFSEDPLRVLRVARFSARFDQLGFKVADETMNLMQDMVVNDEVTHLVAERVWKETQKALDEASPQEYFEVLRRCGALKQLFPEIDQLFGVPQPPRYHPEIDCGKHTMMVLHQAARLTDDTQVRFAALLHDLGKGITPRDQWPSHKGHEQNGTHLIQGLCDRYKVPRAYRELALLVARHHGVFRLVSETLKATTIVKLFQALDAFRRPQRLEQYILACEADLRGRSGFADIEVDQSDNFRTLFRIASEITAQDVMNEQVTDKAISEALYNKRVTAIKRELKRIRKLHQH